MEGVFMDVKRKDMSGRQMALATFLAAAILASSLVRAQDCQVSCDATAQVVPSLSPPTTVIFTATVTATGCLSSPECNWTFGDGAMSSGEQVEHTYTVAGTYAWKVTVIMEDPPYCTREGTVTITCGEGGGGIPGDCSGGGQVTIADLQKAVNMSLGALAPSCGVDLDGGGSVAESEVKVVEDSFMGKNPAPGSQAVSMYPPSAVLAAGETASFQAALDGCGSSFGVDWSVEEGDAGGTITPEGLYTAPSSPGTFHVVATSKSDPSKRATAAVSVAITTLLAEQVVYPSQETQFVEVADRIVVEVAPGGLEKEATVKIFEASGLPDPPPQYEVKTAWFSVTVDDQAPPEAFKITLKLPLEARRARGEAQTHAVIEVGPDGGSRVPSIVNDTSATVEDRSKKKRYIAIAASTWSSTMVCTTDHFTIYYYNEGSDAPPSDYEAINHADPNVPDFIEDLAYFLENAYNKYVNEWHLRAPAADSHTHRVTVTVGNYATSEWGKFSGEIYVANQFNSKSELGSNWERVKGKDRTLLQWEMAHELFHAVSNQYRNIFGMGWVLWLSESLCNFAARQVTPDGQMYLDVISVNGADFPRLQYWDTASGDDQIKYMGAGFFDYAAKKGAFAIDASFMENRYTAANNAKDALDDLLNWRPPLKALYAEYVKWFLFSDESPLAKIYYPYVRKNPKDASRYRNGLTAMMPNKANRLAWDWYSGYCGIQWPCPDEPKDEYTFTLGGPDGLPSWTADYIAIFPSRDRWLPKDPNVKRKFKVEMLTEVLEPSYATLVSSKHGKIIKTEPMPRKGVVKEITVSGSASYPDAFYVLVVNANLAARSPVKHQVKVHYPLTYKICNGGMCYGRNALLMMCYGKDYDQDTAWMVGGKPPYQFFVVGGTMPDELLFNRDTGRLSGTIYNQGVTNFYKLTIEVEDRELSRVRGQFWFWICRQSTGYSGCKWCVDAVEGGAP
jgi:PKD repeat protein